MDGTIPWRTVGASLRWGPANLSISTRRCSPCGRGLGRSRGGGVVGGKWRPGQIRLRYCDGWCSQVSAMVKQLFVLTITLYLRYSWVVVYGFYVIFVPIAPSPATLCTLAVAHRPPPHRATRGCGPAHWHGHSGMASVAGRAIRPLPGAPLRGGEGWSQALSPLPTLGCPQLPSQRCIWAISFFCCNVLLEHCIFFSGVGGEVQ